MKRIMRQVGKHRFSVLVWLLVLSLIVPMFPPPRAAAAGAAIRPASVTATIPFGDVNPTDWYYEAVMKMQEKGIFSGTDADRFSPKGTMTRAMYVTALGRMAGADVGAAAASSFADVPAGSWYAPYMEWAAKQGIVEGTGSGKFSPDATVSREQMAAMTLRYFESYRIPYQTETAVATKPRDLASISSWAADAVIKLWQAGVFTGDAQGNFNPRAQASRAEAAVLFARSSEVVDVWKGLNPSVQAPDKAPTTPSSTSANGGNGGQAGTVNNGGGSAGGGNSGSDPGNGTDSASYTLTFESNGGTAIASQTVKAGQALTGLPAPRKTGSLFQGWFVDRDLTLIFAEGSTVSGNTTLYAKYTDSLENAVESVPSYSVTNVAPTYTIAVTDSTGSLDPSEVKAGMNIVDTSNPEFEGVSVTGGSGLFTIASAADNGRFAEGHTYQLTLTNDALSFRGQDPSTDIYVFSVAKAEVLNIPLNPNMIYLPFANIKNMKLNGADVKTPAIPAITTSVGSGEPSLAEASAASGTFVYEGSPAIQVGDTVSIYQGIRPDQRTAKTDVAGAGDVAYVRITSVNGYTYTYGQADPDQVLFKPDVLPVSTAADTDGDPDNHSITVEHAVLNYSDDKYEPLGLNELTTVDVGDFIAFYRGEFAGSGFESAGFGRITSVTSAAEKDIIVYTEATAEDIQHNFDAYQTQQIDGEDLLSQEEIAQIEKQIEQQARDSGFMDRAADYLSKVAMETESFKAQTFRAGGGSRVSVENLTVVASLGTTVKNIKGRTSGVNAKLQVGVDIVVNLGEEGDLVIHMTGTFVQEISLSLNIDTYTEWKEILFIPYVDDYVVTANLDAYSYTGINIKAEIALVEADQLEAALENWIGEKNAGRLGKVKNIAEEIEAILEGVEDQEVDAESLQEQYKEMLEEDTEWVTLFKKKLFSQSMRVLAGTVEVAFQADFVVSAQVNVTIGADFYYKMAKRYSVSFRVLSLSGSMNTVSLPEDGDYQFTFYVMGTLGIKAGLHMEVKAGLFSVKLNSFGVSVEPGVYINLWGYFYYQLKNINGIRSTDSFGALYAEIGIYLESKLGVQLGDGALSGGITLFDKTWPLYTIGQPVNVYEFDYPQDEQLGLKMTSYIKSTWLPNSLFTMKTFDLTSGETKTQLYPISNFDIQFDNANFRFNPQTRMVETVNTNRPSITGNLIVTWKGTPMSFTSEPLRREIPLLWLARSGDYTLQLDPRNGGLSQVITAAYDKPISVSTPVYAGYTFDGWYTAAAGGTKVALTNRMTAEDRTLYAHWIANKNTPYKIEHYLIDPNASASAMLVPAYTEVLKGTTDTEIVKTFDRYKDQGYSVPEVNGVYIKGDGSTVVKVKYYPLNRTLTFDRNYAGAAEIRITEPFGKDFSGRAPIPTRPGYAFAGWSPEVPKFMPKTNTAYTANWTAKTDTLYKVAYLKQDMASGSYTVADIESYRGTTGADIDLASLEPKSYEGFARDDSAAGAVLTGQIAGDGTTVLKVYYKRVPYSIKIDYNGSGQSTKTVEVPFGATPNLYLGTPERQGYTFAGWSPAPPATMPAENIELTAQWTANLFTASFENNGGTDAIPDQDLGYGDLVSEPVEPTKDGYVFGGWYSDSALTAVYDFSASVTGNLTLYAKWLSTYKISFESNGGSAVTGQTVNEGSKATAPAAPTRDGYVFGGWYGDSSLTNVYDFTAEIVTENKTLYAKWAVYVPTVYAVSFESGGGTAVTEQSVNEGAVASAPPAPTRAGYTFGGWYKDSALTSAYGFTEGVTADLTLYAKWTLNAYTVSFDSRGGSAVSGQAVNEGDAAANPETPTREGYAFGGWYSNNTLTNLYDFAAPVTSNLTLYAKWTTVYTVNFDSGGGTAVAAQTLENGDYATEPSAPSKAGFTFGGWYSDSALNEAYTFGTAVTANLTLYAKWVSESYTVSFDSNGGSSVSSQSVSPGGKAASPTAPTLTGYVFAGWYTDLAGTKPYDFAAAVTSDLTLYAKWTASPWQTLGATAYTDTPYSNLVVDSQGTVYRTFYTGYGESAVQKYVNGAWTKIGDFAGGVLAIDSQDNLYLAYPTSDHVFVKKYNGSTWELVGADGVNHEGLELSTGIEISLSFDSSDRPYVAFSVGNKSHFTRVAKYDGNDWVFVGTYAGPEERFGDPALFLDQNNIPYVFQMYYGAQDIGLIASKYANADWQSVGSRILPVDWKVAAAYGFDNHNLPYMLYIQDSKLILTKYTGSAWENVGNIPASVAEGTRSDFNADLAFDSQGTPYAAYRDAANGNKLTVLKYQNGWIPVGSVGFSEEKAYNVHLFIDKYDNVYASYMNGQSGGMMTVTKYSSNP